MKQVTFRQLACYCGFILMSMKVLSLPSLLYSFNQRGGLVVGLLLMMVEVLMIVLALFIKRKFPNMALYELISMKLGKFVAKFVYFLLAVVVFCQLSFLMNEYINYMRDFVYEEITSIYFVAVFLPIASCLVFNGLKNFARTMELSFIFVIIAFAFCLFVGEGAIQLDELGPFFINGTNGFFSSLFNISFFFSDFIFIFMILDKVKEPQKSYFSFFVVLGIVFVLMAFLYISYFGLYSTTAYFHKNAIANVTEYGRIIGNVGNLDIFTTLFCLFSLFFQGTIFFYQLKIIYEKIFGYENKVHSLIVINIITLILQFIVFVDLGTITNFITTTMRYWSILTFGLIPLYLIFLLLFVKKWRRRSEYNKKILQKNNK